MIQDPAITHLQNHGAQSFTSYDDLPNKESAYEEYERIGEEAAAAAVGVIQAWILERYRDEITAAEISSMKECLIGNIAELITEVAACEYDLLPATLMDAESRAYYDGDM